MSGNVLEALIAGTANPLRCDAWTHSPSINDFEGAWLSTSSHWNAFRSVRALERTVEPFHPVFRAAWGTAIPRGYRKARE